MAEFYLDRELAVAELARVGDAAGLLAWAERVAAAVSPAEVYRSREGRVTLRFAFRGRSFFLKLHRGIGWREICKNLVQLRLPVISASNEYRAVSALRQLGVDTLTVSAYARQGFNPGAVHSMIVTEDLEGTVSLEDYCADWARRPPPPGVRLRLLRKLADSARRMHGAGINHRDFYLCHFHLDPASLASARLRCYLIDLHRAQLRRHTPLRWRIKDLAGLYFSAMDCGLGRRDLWRFMHYYSAGGLAQALGPDRGLWQQVARQALQLYGKTHGERTPASWVPELTRG
jgi:heptose I phosphotransferase